GQEAARPAQAPVAMRSPVQDKNFYILSLLERSPALRDELERDPGLTRIHAGKMESLKAAAGCKTELTCYTQALKWTDREIETVEQSLRALQRTSNLFRETVSRPVRASGLYQLHSSLDDADLVAWAWKDVAAGINRAISIYGEGAAPRYPEIDSIAYDVK